MTDPRATPDPRAMPDDGLLVLAQRIIAHATQDGLGLATAESLTAGDVVARLVDVPGASACVRGGAACYTAEAKHRVLGVDAALLAAHGAVTEEVARQMARGALELYAADFAVATTGVAGPGPDERGVPAGTVFVASAQRGGPTRTTSHHFEGDRSAVRRASVHAALALLADTLEESHVGR